MAWQAEIPSLPQSIADLPNEKLRRRAEAAWNAAQTLDSAICDWEPMFRRREDFDFARADEIAKAGRAAITTLGAMRVRCPSIQVSEDAPESFYAVSWPVPPSEIIDKEWYTDPLYRQEVATQLALIITVLGRDVSDLLNLLRQSPLAAFIDAAVGCDGSTIVAAETPDREQQLLGVGESGVRAKSGSQVTMDHSADFVTVNWGDKDFVFGIRQAACLCVMWKAFEARTTFQSQDFILLNAAETYKNATGVSEDVAKELTGLDHQQRLRDVFKIKGSRVHSAWGSLIVKDGKNAFGLKSPPNNERSHKIPT